jgi:polyisoprenoid-binding protein YceI
MRRLLAPLFGLVLAWSATASAGAAPYAFDAVHTTAAFTAVHLAIIKVHGSVPFTGGSMDLGPNDLPTAGKASFDLSKIDSGDSNRDNSLRTQYLETDKYPTMTFVVRKATGTPQAFDLSGDLTLHGVTKPVTLKASVTGTSQFRGKREVGYSATTTIDRRDFGINFGTGLANGPLGASTDIVIDIECGLIESN